MKRAGPTEPPLRNLWLWIVDNPGATRSEIRAAHPTLPDGILRHRLLLLELGGWVEFVEGEYQAVEARTVPAVPVAVA